MRHTMRLPENTVDSELVTLARHGDKQAFDLLVQKYQYKILKLVGRYVNDQSEALDVAQDAFIKAFNSLPKFRGESAFYTWLYRIAINTAKNYALSQNRRILGIDVEIIDTEQTLNKNTTREFAAPEKIIQDIEIEQVINEIVEHLPKDLRMAIILREVEGLTYDEIAAVMSCPVGTVRSRIFRAREAIERRLRHLLGGII